MFVHIFAGCVWGQAEMLVGLLMAPSGLFKGNKERAVKMSVCMKYIWQISQRVGRIICREINMLTNAQTADQTHGPLQAYD